MINPPLRESSGKYFQKGELFPRYPKGEGEFSPGKKSSGPLVNLRP
jgi:hypothetical protein